MSEMVYRCVVDFWMERGFNNPIREKVRKTILFVSTSTSEAMELAEKRSSPFAPLDGLLKGVECVECSGFAFPYALPDPTPKTHVTVHKHGNNRPKRKRRV